MKVLKILGGLVAGLVVLIVLLFIVARMGDGPIGPIPGGQLVTGELIAPPADWTFATDIEEIEMQLADEDTSRTTWILVDRGSAYIPCSLGFPPGKNWYHRVDPAADAMVRVEGKRHPVRLERVRDAATQAALVEVAKGKYLDGPPGEAEVWFFRIGPRAS